MGNHEERSSASDRSADVNDEDENASDRAESPVEYKLPIYNKGYNSTKFICKSSSETRYSRDGRYAYCLCEHLSELRIVDFVRHARLLLKPKQSSFEGGIEEFLLVNPTTIVALGDCGLWLLRMHLEDEEFEALQLAFHDSAPTYVFIEITGEDVDVKQGVLQRRREYTELLFCRLYVDDARLDVDWTKAVDGTENFFQLSKDGRSLFEIPALEYDVLSVYDIEQKKWTTRKTSGYRVEWYVSFKAFRSPEKVYFLATGEEDEAAPFKRAAYRCDLKEAKWEMLWGDANEIREIVPLVDAESGDDEGFLAVRYEEVEGTYRVDRYLLNTVDSLEHLAMDAFRKHYMNVKGDFNFHFFLNETTPGKKILPSMYANMKPLP